ncbi:cytochrome P450 [Ceratobasidium sp. AG-I]|nr:cytochrome P450 [Ceratobasidium sp. AG-I]
MASSYLTIVSATLWMVLSGIYIRKRNKPKTLPMPPSPKPDFLIGNLRSMPALNAQNVYRQWSEEFGSDIISLNIMGMVFIVLNSVEAATELLVKRSSIYSDRPQVPLICSENLMGWGKHTALLPYGDQWRRQRRMTHEVLHRQASKSFWPVVTKQSRLALQRILVNPNNYPEELRRMAGSTLLSAVYGYEVTSADERLVKMVEAAFNQLGQVAASPHYLVNIIPWLQYVPTWFPGAGWKRNAKAWSAERDEMLRVPYDWTKTQIASGTAPNSILKRLLTKLASQEHTSDLEEEEDRIMWAAGVLFGGGSDTSSATALVFILAMTLYQDVQTKAQAEIDSFLGGSRLPEMEDQESLPYINNIVKEVYRWRSVVPLGIPHASIQEDVYKGYRIPKGSMIIANTWAMSNDPTQYPNPEEFNPDRFRDPITPDAPTFGFGRRSCPGIHLAHANLFITVATFLAIFDIRPIYDADGIPQLPKGDMVLDSVLSVPMPFECTITPRSDKHRQLLREWSEV